MNRFQDLDVDQALGLIVEGTAAETGTRFYDALVQSLAATLNTTGAWVTEYVEELERLRAISFWINGEWITDYEYDLPGTPCALVIKESRLVHVPDNVSQLFPNDPDLKSFGAVSYMGFPLLDDNGRVLGHVAVSTQNHCPPNLAWRVCFAYSPSAQPPSIDGFALKQNYENAKKSLTG